MGIEKEELAYFDYACNKYGFLRNYLHYLHPSSIQIILLLANPDLNKKQVIDELNEKHKQYREFTTSRLDKKIMDMRCKLSTIHQHAVLFGIEKDIKPLSVSQLERIIEEYTEKQAKEYNE